MTEETLTPSSDERALALVLYLSTFVAALFGPLVIWLLKKDESQFIDVHGREALNLWLSTLIYSVVVVLLSLLSFGLLGFILIPALIVWSLVIFVATLIACFRAYEGRVFRFPMILRLL